MGKCLLTSENDRVPISGLVHGVGKTAIGFYWIHTEGLFVSSSPQARMHVVFIQCPSIGVSRGKRDLFRQLRLQYQPQNCIVIHYYLYIIDIILKYIICSETQSYTQISIYILKGNVITSPFHALPFFELLFSYSYSNWDISYSIPHVLVCLYVRSTEKVTMRFFIPLLYLAVHFAFPLIHREIGWDLLWYSMYYLVGRRLLSPQHKWTPSAVAGSGASLYHCCWLVELLNLGLSATAAEADWDRL